MRAECVVALQNHISDWSRIDYRSAIVKTMHVRAHGGEMPQKLATVNRYHSENKYNDPNALFERQREMFLGQCRLTHRV